MKEVELLLLRRRRHPLPPPQHLHLGLSPPLTIIAFTPHLTVALLQSLRQDLSLALSLPARLMRQIRSLGLALPCSPLAPQQAWEQVVELERTLRLLPESSSTQHLPRMGPKMELALPHHRTALCL
jgi:hypothetical protein